MMNPNDFGDPLTFPLAPPWGWYEKTKTDDKHMHTLDNLSLTCWPPSSYRWGLRALLSGIMREGQVPLFSLSHPDLSCWSRNWTSNLLVTSLLLHERDTWTFLFTKILSVCQSLSSSLFCRFVFRIFICFFPLTAHFVSIPPFSALASISLLLPCFSFLFDTFSSLCLLGQNKQSKKKKPH